MFILVCSEAARFITRFNLIVYVPWCPCLVSPQPSLSKPGRRGFPARKTLVPAFPASLLSLVLWLWHIRSNVLLPQYLVPGLPVASYGSGKCYAFAINLRIVGVFAFILQHPLLTTSRQGHRSRTAQGCGSAPRDYPTPEQVTSVTFRTEKFIPSSVYLAKFNCSCGISLVGQFLDLPGLRLGPQRLPNNLQLEQQ